MPLKKNSQRNAPVPPPTAVDANQIVAANLKLAREMHGWTQTEVANILNEATGATYTKATISAMERSAEGGKRRLFDAQELLVFSRVFYVPIVWFFIPTPDLAPQRLALMGDERVGDIIEFLFGRDEGRRLIGERLQDLKANDPDGIGETWMNLVGHFSDVTWSEYKASRDAAIAALAEEERGTFIQSMGTVVLALTDFQERLEEVVDRGYADPEFRELLRRHLGAN